MLTIVHGLYVLEENQLKFTIKIILYDFLLINKLSFISNGSEHNQSIYWEIIPLFLCDLLHGLCNSNNGSPICFVS